jgi:RND family efflux transporter MFP subunit
MSDRLFWLVRPLLTLVVAALAVLLIRWMWAHYEVAPWTRDGRVRADVVTVSPDVAGFVVGVTVVDNQVVREGEPLFQLDRARYEATLRQAVAAVERERVVLAQARREVRRNETLRDVVAFEVREQSQARAEEAAAILSQGLAEVAIAQLNLERTTVVAPVNGIVTNLELRPGDYLTAGREALALVDTDSLHVDGYFEETKLPGIHVGDRVSVKLMGESRVLYGRVHSIAGAIEDRERTANANLLANINPTFSWVRLAQRVPVRVELDATPSDVRLIAGRTATVVVLGGDSRISPVRAGGNSR